MATPSKTSKTSKTRAPLKAHGTPGNARVADLKTLHAFAREWRRAQTKFPSWPMNPFHALGVVAEEFGECVDAAADCMDGRGTIEAVRAEAIQLGAMVARFVESIDQYDWRYDPAAAAAAGERDVAERTVRLAGKSGMLCRLAMQSIYEPSKSTREDMNKPAVRLALQAMILSMDLPGLDFAPSPQQKDGRAAPALLRAV